MVNQTEQQQWVHRESWVQCNVLKIFIDQFVEFIDQQQGITMLNF
jgi:hypothetical protein